MCKFTPLGFETVEMMMDSQYDNGVNLPRWGLKRVSSSFLPSPRACKFTPLGFETRDLLDGNHRIDSVNLPRWGLKRKPTDRRKI